MLYTCTYLLAQVGWYSAVKNRKILSASQIPLFLFCLEILFLYLFSFAGWLLAAEPFGVRHFFPECPSKEAALSAAQYRDPSIPDWTGLGIHRLPGCD